MAVSDGTARTLIAGGQLAPVAVLSRQRSTLLPEVPTIFEVAAIGDEQAWWLDYRAGLTELGRTLIAEPGTPDDRRSEEHTSELQSLMRISYAVFCLKKKQTADTYSIHN